ncbi:invertebrate-type lysozyme 3-like [Macrosteles quadrilineatus]|uniref:invertebrate-type lysozyme 3-like n=1 Tax=Macrosteles quadrilineatus TaxID=74068 RepID=UPI0023E24FCA|nr:invertebrate-type lysozyme 3-like [Macrosteles quadrilineatus]
MEGTKTLLFISSLVFLVGGCLCIDSACVKCLCEFINEESSCSYLVGCHNDVCGPYGITEPYWTDAGRPRYENGKSKNKYKECTNSASCAELTIKNYMDKYAQDCNDDGRIDCYDYAAIHANGPAGCKGSLRRGSIKVLRKCLDRSNSSPEEPEDEEDPKEDAETFVPS